MGLGDRLNDKVNEFSDVLYVPLDKAGGLGARVAGSVVEKTGVSRYSYAGACNIAGVIAGSATAFDAFSQGRGWVGVISALFTGYHVLGAVHNHQLSDAESSGMGDEGMKSAESMNVRHAAGLVAMGLGLGATFGVCYLAGDMQDQGFVDSLRVLSGLGATVLFGGLEGLFKGAKTSK